MSTLSAFAAHCRAMSTADHVPECPSLARLGSPNHVTWNPAPLRPNCDGCLTDSDRDLFAKLAAEIEAHMAPQPDLFGGESAEPETDDESRTR